jgi:hypothetical protein
MKFEDPKATNGKLDNLILSFLNRARQVNVWNMNLEFTIKPWAQHGTLYKIRLFHGNLF